MIKYFAHIAKHMDEYASKGILKSLLITTIDGQSLSEKPKYYPLAQKTATTLKPQKISEDLSWYPIIIDEEVVCVAMLKGNSAKRSEQLKLLTGLAVELSYRNFLESELEESLDPRSRFIKQLFTGDEISSMEEATDRGDIIGLNLRYPQAVILIKVPGFFKKWHLKYRKLPLEERNKKIQSECTQTAKLFDKAFNNFEQNVFACLDEDMIVCLKWASGNINTTNTIKFYRQRAKYLSEFTEKELGIKPTIGVGQYYPGLKGMLKSYHDAETALEVGEKIWGEGNIYHILDIGMLVSISKKVSFERKCELALQILGPILKDEVLYKTVKTFIDSDLNLSVAAQKLHLHRNTLIYRLNKIKKQVGLDPKKFSDAIQIKLGILLYGPSIRCN